MDYSICVYLLNVPILLTSLFVIYNLMRRVYQKKKQTNKQTNKQKQKPTTTTTTKVVKEWNHPKNHEFHPLRSKRRDRPFHRVVSHLTFMKRGKIHYLREEVARVIKVMAEGKAPGFDCITGEELKASGKARIDILHINLLWWLGLGYHYTHLQKKDKLDCITITGA